MPVSAAGCRRLHATDRSHLPFNLSPSSKASLLHDWMWYSTDSKSILVSPDSSEVLPLAPVDGTAGQRADLRPFHAASFSKFGSLLGVLCLKGAVLYRVRVGVETGFRLRARLRVCRSGGRAGRKGAVRVRAQVGDGKGVVQLRSQAASQNQNLRSALWCIGEGRYVHFTSPDPIGYCRKSRAEVRCSKRPRQFRGRWMLEISSFACPAKKHIKHPELSETARR